MKNLHPSDSDLSPSLLDLFLEQALLESVFVLFRLELGLEYSRRMCTLIC